MADALEILAAMSGEHRNAVERSFDRIPISYSFDGDDQDCDVVVDPQIPFKLVYARMHFISDSIGLANFSMSLLSRLGDFFNVSPLYSVDGRGVGQDVIYSFSDSEKADPSGLVFQSGDRIRCQWTRPDVVDRWRWGLEVGIQPLL